MIIISESKHLRYFKKYVREGDADPLTLKICRSWKIGGTPQSTLSLLSSIYTNYTNRVKYYEVRGC